MPKQPEKKPDDQAMTLRLPRPWHDDLRERAYRERRHISDLIREALKAHFGYPNGEANA